MSGVRFMFVPSPEGHATVAKAAPRTTAPSMEPASLRRRNREGAIRSRARTPCCVSATRRGRDARRRADPCAMLGHHDDVLPKSGRQHQRYRRRAARPDDRVARRSVRVGAARALRTSPMRSSRWRRVASSPRAPPTWCGAPAPGTPVEALPRDALIVPGFVDCHVHYPQLPVIGSHGTQLLDWLERYTFPAEAAFGDAGYARAVARDYLRREPAPAASRRPRCSARRTPRRSTPYSRSRDARHAR